VHAEFIGFYDTPSMCGDLAYFGGSGRKLLAPL
jgi:hypothetical protein